MKSLNSNLSILLLSLGISTAVHADELERKKQEYSQAQDNLATLQQEQLALAAQRDKIHKTNVQINKIVAAHERIVVAFEKNLKIYDDARSQFVQSLEAEFNRQKSAQAWIDEISARLTDPNLDPTELVQIRHELLVKQQAENICQRSAPIIMHDKGVSALKTLRSLLKNYALLLASTDLPAEYKSFESELRSNLKTLQDQLVVIATDSDDLLTTINPPEFCEILPTLHLVINYRIIMNDLKQNLVSFDETASKIEDILQTIDSERAAIKLAASTRRTITGMLVRLDKHILAGHLGESDLYTESFASSVALMVSKIRLSNQLSANEKQNLEALITEKSDKVESIRQQYLVQDKTARNLVIIRAKSFKLRFLSLDSHLATPAWSAFKSKVKDKLSFLANPNPSTILLPELPQRADLRAYDALIAQAEREIAPFETTGGTP